MMLSNSSNEGMQMGENVSSSSFGEVDLSSLNEEQQQLLAKELIRNTPEYKAAWELELWKKREKQVFKKQLEQKEQMHLQKVEAALREEYSKKDKQLTDQREMLKQKEMKYTQALEDMEKREKQLIQVEQELRRRKTELESDYARKLEHMEHVIKMEKESFQHRLQLETIKNQELQKRIDQQLSHDVMELNEKITKLQVENESLESKLHETTNSKQSYKLQWKKVTEELQRAKKKHEAELRKLHQQVMALHQLQQQVTPSVNPTSPFQYPSAYTTNPVYYDSNLLNHHPLGSTPPRISSEKHEDEVNTLKTLISDLIKKEERDQKKQDKQLNTSSSSSSSGEDSRNSSPSPPRKKREVSSSKKTRSTPQDSSPLLDGSYEQADKDNNNETQDISLDAQTFSNSSPSNPFKEDSRSKEVNRLLREKARLLKSGIYNENSDIILEIDKKIQSL
ncbi:hypothetical protein C9374_002399 [Naegleria lovaniensis]|uniref:Uncharacterized protein n=1 Tax=Naegleria lovaniensis TaxID=51637 RepID=A0AA88GTL1_NAELO|nr:uncharacterized protein C9374_002399 [Naegleria lovaniensis]KAG2386655.1 hypothetical protein C9374_002399 [Naegleria lovaniensis]